MPVTPSFRLLRQALRGRIFTEQEAEVGQNRKVILSYGLWQRLFGGRDEAVGKELRINGNQFTIVGVMPREFRFIDPECNCGPRSRSRRRNRRTIVATANWQQFARLKPGASIDQARARSMRSTCQSRAIPAAQAILINAGFNTKVKPFQADLIEGSARTLMLLLGRGALSW